MPFVKMSFSDGEYQWLESEYKKSGEPSIQAHIKKVLGLTNADPKPTDIALRGLASAKQLSAGTVFGLPQFFPKNDWKGWSKGTRIQAGKAFFQIIMAGQHGIRDNGKTKANLQLYIRE